jgi:hypothetical protein
MKYLRITALILVILLLIPALVVTAQDETEDCDYTKAIETITELTALLPDADDPVEVMDEITSVIAAAKIECSGLSFNSDDDGLEAVIGPVDIPEGLYRATATADGFLAVQIEPLEGDCGPTGFGSAIFNLSQGDAVDGAESLLESDGCSALIITSNTGFTPLWTLTFEKLR